MLKKKTNFFVCILLATDEKSKIRIGAQIRIRIRTKMSRIHNTAYNTVLQRFCYLRDPDLSKSVG
jgi:hypothetical protein